MLKPTAAASRRRQRGLSIVELMVGVAVGLFVVAAATMLVATHLADSRRLTLETQVQQDLRAAADIITRELRRSGHWAKARDGVGQPLNVNAYRAVSKDGTPPTPFTDGEVSTSVLISYSRSGSEAAENNAVDSAEQLGFRLVNGVIQTHLGDADWQALTDSSTLNVTAFTLTLNVQPIRLECTKPCPGPGDCRPELQVRDITLDITGQAAHDASVQRRLTSNVRLRNDAVIAGSCPP